MAVFKQVLDGLAFIVRRLWENLFKLLSALLFAWLILSHTVGWAADLTAAIFRSAFSVVTTSATAKSDVDIALRDNAQLRSELDAERARVSRLHANLDGQNRRISDLNTDLSGERARSIYYQDRFETSNHQAITRQYQIDRLQIDLDASQARSAQLEAISQRPILFRGERVPTTQAINTTIHTVSARTQRTAAANLSSTFGESVPFYGIAFIVTATTYELTAACHNMRDLYDLQVAVDPASAFPEDRDIVCGLQVPTKEELWAEVRASPQRAWSASVSALEATRSSLVRVGEIELPSLDLPDISIGLDRATEALMSTRGSLSWIK